MSEDIISSIKKEALSKAGSAAIQTSASFASTQSSNEAMPTITESKGLRSESPITLSYGRVFQGDGEKFELILLYCYQCLIDASDKPSIVQVCNWFQTHKHLKITFTSPQLAGVVPAKISFTPTYTFNQESLLPILKDVPDIKVPTNIKAIANDYSNKKGSWPVKLACLQLIAALTDQIYSNIDNFSTIKRKEQLNRLETFVRHLQDKTEFSFLVGQGKRFKSFLDNCNQTLRAGLDDIEKIAKKPLQIDKWLAAYYMHATELLDQLIPYSDHLLQDIEISESSHQVLTMNVYEIYKNIVKKSAAINLSLDRAKSIHSILERTIAIIKKEGLGSQSISLTSLKELVAAKKLNLVEAGFYYDYVLNSPDSWPALLSALSGKTPYHLTADQFLRELIYGFRELKAFKNNEVLKAALAMYKHKTGDRAEYALAMLRCRVLNPKNLFDEALYLKQQSQQDKAAFYLHLAKQAFSPILIDLANDPDKHIAVWLPGVIATFNNLTGFSRGTGSTTQYLAYAKTVLSLISIYPQLSAYAWFTKSLEWATRGMGNDTIAVIYRDFLQSLSQHTLETILPIISHVLLEMDATNGSSLRNKLRTEAQEYKASESIRHWQHQQAGIEQKPFYRDLLRSLWMLKNICKSLEKYVCDANILAGIKENQSLAEMLILACDPVDKSLPDAKQQMTTAKVFFDDIHTRLHKLLNGSKEDKERTPSLEPEEVKIDFTPPSSSTSSLSTPPVSPAKSKPQSSPLLNRPETPPSPETTIIEPPEDNKGSAMKKLDSYLSDSLYEVISLPALLQEFLRHAKDIVSQLPYQSLTKSRNYYEKIGNVFSKISKNISDTDENFATIKAQIVMIKKDLVDEISVIFVSQLQAEEEPDARSQELHRLNQALLKELQTMLAQVINLNQLSDGQYIPSSSFSKSSPSISYEHKAVATTTSQRSTPNSKRRLSLTGSSNLFPASPKTDAKALKPQQEQYLYLPATEENASSSTTTIATFPAHTNIVEEDLEEEDQYKCVIS
jgi:hypothetical protein